jgi:hypothetical protein
MIERSEPTTDPGRAGPLPEEFIFRRWSAGPGAHTTSRQGQAWKHVLDDNGKLRPFACPECGEDIVFIDGGKFVGCWSCAWAPSMMTRAERADLEARDPEMIPVLQFLEKMEKYVPRFEGHANNKRISGKERREKRLRSQCAYTGGA